MYAKTMQPLDTQGILVTGILLTVNWVSGVLLKIGVMPISWAQLVQVCVFLASISTLWRNWGSPYYQKYMQQRAAKKAAADKPSNPDQ